jgi:hypothetical protein
VRYHVFYKTSREYIVLLGVHRYNSFVITLKVLAYTKCLSMHKVDKICSNVVKGSNKCYKVQPNLVVVSWYFRYNRGQTTCVSHNKL